MLVYVVGVIGWWIGVFVVSIFWERERRRTGEDYMIIPFLVLGFIWPVLSVMLIPACVLFLLSRMFSFIAGKIVDWIDRRVRAEDEQEKD